MKIEGWKYYIHAAIPSIPPHEKVNIEPIENKTIWKMDGSPLLARWTSEWDCGYETNWWYCIKDTPFDISSLKSKRRYEINKGNKYFYVNEIKPTEYGEDLYRITSAAYEFYPASYRPEITHDGFIEGIKHWDFYKTYGAFSYEDGKLYGYACLLKDGVFIDFRNLKVMPEKEKQAINAAIINKILFDHEEFLSIGGYICDGARNIQHETAFQNYLEKYFGFRKAYCKLHIAYTPRIRWVVKILFPFKKILHRFDEIGFVHQINSVLYMEELCRSEAVNE